MSATIVFASCVESSGPCNDTMGMDLGVPALVVLVIVVAAVILGAVAWRRRMR